MCLFKSVTYNEKSLKVLENSMSLLKYTNNEIFAKVCSWTQTNKQTRRMQEIRDGFWHWCSGKLGGPVEFRSESSMSCHYHKLHTHTASLAPHVKRAWTHTNKLRTKITEKENKSICITILRKRVSWSLQPEKQKWERFETSSLNRKAWTKCSRYFVQGTENENERWSEEQNDWRLYIEF